MQQMQIEPIAPPNTANRKRVRIAVAIILSVSLIGIYFHVSNKGLKIVDTSDTSNSANVRKRLILSYIEVEYVMHHSV